MAQVGKDALENGVFVCNSSLVPVIQTEQPHSDTALYLVRGTALAGGSVGRTKEEVTGIAATAAHGP